MGVEFFQLSYLNIFYYFTEIFSGGLGAARGVEAGGRQCARPQLRGRAEVRLELRGGGHRHPQGVRRPPGRNIQ